jgi:hypothetical protein
VIPSIFIAIVAIPVILFGGLYAKPGSALRTVCAVIGLLAVGLAVLGFPWGTALELDAATP